MLSYAIRRLLFLPIVLILLALMIFALQMMLTPMQRLALYAPSPDYLKGGEAFIKSLIDLYGLDDPFLVQFGRWIGNVARGNLGWSETARMPVAQAIATLFPATLELALFSFVPVILGAIWLGTKAATHHNRLTDHSVRVFTILGWSFPDFVFGLLALMVFYGSLRWFPPGRLSPAMDAIVRSDAFHRYTRMNVLDAILNGNGRVLLDSLRHLVLPVITLAYVNWASMVRIMRSSMLETLRQDYVTTARAKGLTERNVENRHARRNALLPVTTVSGFVVAWMMGGVVIIESIFDYHGLGRFAANAAANLDFSAILGFALYFAVLLVVVNLIVDLLYAYLDPRVKLA